MCIKASNFSFRYSKNLPYILKDLNFTINKGKVTSITGQNGAGKSTLAMVIGGLYKLNKKNSQGEIKKGENIFGVVFQDPTMQILFDTVQEDIEFILSNYNVPKKEWEERIKLALDQVGMEGREKENPLTYSGGQKQRIAIAGMLALHPDYLIFDEASAHLDIEGKELFRKIVKKEASLGRGVIIVTNDPNEFDLADKNINLG